MCSVCEFIPVNVRVSFLLHRRSEWEKVLETTVAAKSVEQTAESQVHWANVSSYALLQISAIDKQLRQLKVD
jgi:hypothetical protein